MRRILIGLGVALAMFDRVTAAAGAMLALFVVRALSLAPTYAFMLSRRAPVVFPRGMQGWWLLLGAAVLDAGGYAFYNIGVDVAPVAVIAPLVAAHPVATIALAVILIHERPTVLQWSGIVVTVGAVVMLSRGVGA